MNGKPPSGLGTFDLTLSCMTRATKTWTGFCHAFIVVLVLSPSAYAETLRCENAFAIEPATPSIVDLFAGEFGYQPKIVSHGETIFLQDPTGQTLAYCDSHFDAAIRVLKIGVVRVAKPFRRFNLYKLMFATLLERTPDAEFIDSVIGDTNEFIYMNALLSGIPRAEAIRETPAFKIRAALGFGTLVGTPGETEDGYPTFRVRRSP